MTSEYFSGGTRLLDFLAAEYDSDGASRSAPDDIQFYYKLPAVMAFAGRRDLAQRTLNQIVERFITGDRFAVDDDPIALPWVAYLAGWAAWGAGALGRFDLAGTIMKSVASRQSAELGGYVHHTDGRRLFDTERSSSAGMGNVWAMDLGAAERVGRFLDHALDAQPEPDRFFTYFDEHGDPIPDTEDRNAFFDVSDPHARPALFATAVSCLVWLGRASGERTYYGVAHRYMQLVLGHNEDPATLPLATKTGWSALMLAEQVDDPRLEGFARRNGEDLLDRLQPDGSIDFDGVPEVPKPVARVWQIGWGCDAALTLLALAYHGKGTRA